LRAGHIGETGNVDFGAFDATAIVRIGRQQVKPIDGLSRERGGVTELGALTVASR
jgi:hypothetical protein